MKVPISATHVVDLTAPVLPAYRTVFNGIERWAAWCKHCRQWHFHGPAEGHREAHCSDESSGYFHSGYNLALRGKASRAQLSRMQDDGL